MPLLKRFIEPIYISCNVVPRNISNELDYISNSTFSQIIYQLSSLSKHSEDLFGELHRETSIIMYRTSQLNQRIENLESKIVRLNPVVEEVLLLDINMRKPFKSSVVKEQQIISAHSRPQAIAEVYARVDPPPPLRILNRYREDCRDSLKFYTDPGYFFELWSQEITKDAENQFKKHRHRKGRPVQRPSLEPPPVAHQLKCRRDDIRSDLNRTEPVGNVQLGENSTAFCSSPGKLSAHRFQGNARHADSVFLEDRFSSSPRSASPLSTASRFVFPTMRHERKPERSESERVHSLNQRMNRDEGRGSLRMSPQNVAHSGSGIGPYDAQHLSQIPPHHGRDLYWESSSPQSRVGQSAALTNPDKRFVVSQQAPVSAESTSEHLPQPTEQEDGPRCRSRDSLELPLPPTPPMELPSCYYPMPSPPIIPSPVVEYKPNVSLPSSPILPPSLYKASLATKENFSMEYATGVLPKQLHLNENVFLGVKAHSKEEVADAEVASVEAEDCLDPDRGHRSNLLTAIKKGIQLRKVEERRLKTMQRQQTKVKGQLDVQSIMEAAFEMRRKALDENDSDDDNDDELDNNWSDDN